MQPEAERQSTESQCSSSFSRREETEMLKNLISPWWREKDLNGAITSVTDRRRRKLKNKVSIARGDRDVHSPHTTVRSPIETNVTRARTADRRGIETGIPTRRDGTTTSKGNRTIGQDASGPVKKSNPGGRRKCHIVTRSATELVKRPTSDIRVVQISRAFQRKGNRHYRRRRSDTGTDRCLTGRCKRHRTSSRTSRRRFTRCSRSRRRRRRG